METTEYINIPGDRQLKTLVYCKYLFNQGCKFLENRTNSAYYNISIVLFSNAVELAIKSIDECVNIESNNRNKTHITTIIKDIQKKHITLPYNDIFQLLESRNGVYHNGSLLIYETCNSLKDKSIEILSSITEVLFNDKNFGTLTIANLIQNEKIKSLVLEAEEYFNKEDYVNCNYRITEAFGNFERRLIDRSNSNSGRLLSHIKESQIDIVRVKTRSLDDKSSNTDLRSFSKHVEEVVNRKFEKFIKDFDIIITLRNHYEDYKHFKRMTPIYHLLMNDNIVIDKENKRNIEFNKDNCEFMIDFVVNMMLELEPQFKPIVERYLNGKIHRIIE